MIMLGMFAIGAAVSGSQSDPYAILDKHIAAMGGWSAIDAVRSSHSK
jgi:hypothetical protein